MPADSTLRIGLLLPELMGTYGDNGNATVLQRRLQWRGMDAEIVSLDLGDPVPASLDIYVIGGGEDTCQALAVRDLHEQAGLRQAAERGAVVFGVCAGLQVLGERFTSTAGAIVAGLGLLDVATEPFEVRAIGEIVCQPATADLTEPLTGFENHQGRTTLGPDAKPLGTVRRGRGNGDGTDGVVQGRIVGTYLHGPALARNPELADLLLGWAVGGALADLPLDEVAQLRRERLASAR
jgi:lipid II isoglutaminyl synthase (glutamine-hydrolysing)